MGLPPKLMMMPGIQFHVAWPDVAARRVLACMKKWSWLSVGVKTADDVSGTS